MSDAPTPSAQLHQLFSDEWDFRMREDPLFATLCGEHRFNDRLPPVCEADFARRLERIREFVQRLNAIDRHSLTRIDRLNYDIFKQTLENEIAEIEFRSYRLPIAKSSGFHSSFADVPDYAPLRNTTDYENYISRLEAFPAYVASHIEVMRAGMDEGQLPARIALEGVDDSIQSLISADAERSVFYRPFTDFHPSVAPSARQRLSDAGRKAIEGAITPAYRTLLQFIANEYVPAASEDIAASALPNGRAFYEHRVRSFTTLDVTPQQVHDIGLAEVERIREQMQAIIDKVEFKDGFQAFIQFLRSDKRFYVETPDALMKEVALVLKKMDGELPRLFKTLPRTPYGIKQVPDYLAPNTTTAYYFPSAGDGSRAGTYFVNTYDLKSRPLYEIEALSFHEAVPGHHLQITLQQELDELPNFRRFGWVTAFGEGWALYSERLGLEVGFYQDPYSDFGRLTYNMWRACRLVVDTGMHYLGWTRQRAIDFMTEHTALTPLNIANEIDRYIAWPGQALAYKMGELKIVELRERAEQTLGSRFDVREFHEIVLRDGCIPLAVLEANVQEWLDEA